MGGCCGLSLLDSESVRPRDDCDESRASVLSSDTFVLGGESFAGAEQFFRFSSTLQKLFLKHGVAARPAYEPGVAAVCPEQRLLVLRDGSKWAGCVDPGSSLPVGFGRLLSPAGDFTVGTFREGRVSGPCSIYFNNGRFFTGTATGPGRLRGSMHLEDCVLIGSFVDGLLEGEGRAVYSNGTAVSGEFRRGELDLALATNLGPRRRGAQPKEKTELRRP